jgi:CheY-like chemotaxis protein
MTILCVDDDETAITIRKMVLEMAGYIVLTAGNGQLAMQLFASTAVDIVLSDALLRGMTGTELAAEMKLLKPAIPIAIMSGMMEEPAGMEDADLVIGKGESPSVWLKRLSDLLRRSRSQAA